MKSIITNVPNPRNLRVIDENVVRSVLRSDKVRFSKIKFFNWSLVFGFSSAFVVGYGFGCSFNPNNFPALAVLIMLVSAFISICYGARFNTPIKIKIK